MSARRGAPAGVFELQPSSAFQRVPPNEHKLEPHADETHFNGEVANGNNDYEEEVDESVREDMRKLENTFPGISDRFRLVNRIGEGLFDRDGFLRHGSSNRLTFDSLKGLFQRCTRLRTYCTIITTMTGISCRRRGNKRLGAPRQNDGGLTGSKQNARSQLATWH